MTRFLTVAVLRARASCPGYAIALLAAVAVCGCRSAKPPPEPPIAVERADRSYSQAQTLSDQGNWAAAAAEWKSAAANASLLNDRAREAVALHNLADAHKHLQQYNVAVSNALVAAAINEKLPQKEEWWKNQVLLLQLEALATNRSPAARFEQLLARAQEIPESVRGAFWNEVGLWQQKNGELQRAADSFMRAQSAYADDEEGVAAVIANRAGLLETQGLFDLALRAWVDALRRFEELADPRGIAHSLAGYGRALVNAGRDLSNAEDLLRRAARNYRTLGARDDERHALQWLHKALINQEKFDQAHSLEQQLQ